MSNLKSKILDSRLIQLEATLLNVIEEVLAWHVIKYDVVVLGVLKYVYQFDYIFMLAHFENFNLSPLLEDLDWFHVCLLHSLDGDLFARLFVSCKFDESKLTLTNCLFDIIVSVKVCLRIGFWKFLKPFLLILLMPKIKSPRLSWHKYYPNRV